MRIFIFTSLDQTTHTAENRTLLLVIIAVLEPLLFCNSFNYNKQSTEIQGKIKYIMKKFP